MEIYDISQELFSASLFPGDEGPKRNVLETIKNGSICNLTGLTMCAHNGTHVDAPYHFFDDGETVDELDLSKLVGKCYVSFCNGLVTKQIAEDIINKAKKADEEASRRILIGGDAVVTIEAAKYFAKEKIFLIGNESQTVGPLEAPAAVHYELLGAKVVLLEGIRLEGIKEGIYLLNAAPINLGGADGAPCRAILISTEMTHTSISGV